MSCVRGIFLKVKALTDTTVKPVRDLVFEKSVSTKLKSKSVKLTNDKKEYLDFFSSCDKSRETKR